MTLSSTPSIHPSVKTQPAQPPAAKPAGQSVTAMPSADTLSIQFAGKTAEKQADHLADLRKRGVVVAGGGGNMGSGIAANFLNIGVPVRIKEHSDEALQAGLKRIHSEVSAAVSKGLAPEGTTDLIKGGVSQDITSIPKDTGLVVEAIFENMDAKKDIFQALDKHLDKDAILASNTSSLSIDELAEASGRPDRFIGIHFFFPANKNRFVEIIPGKKTSPETIEKTKAWVRALGKTPILCNNGPGFVVNRMLVPFMNEGVKIWDEEVAKAKEAYKAEHGMEPPAEWVADQEKKLATTIEKAAKEVLWPTYSKNPNVSGLLIGPFSGLNMPEYMGLIKEIVEVLHDNLGEAYKPAQTGVDKANAFRALDRNAPDYEQKFEDLKFKLGGEEDVLHDRLPEFKDRFTGLMIGLAGQLLDEGITTPEDLNRGVAVGTKWEVSPFELINQLGPRKALKLVEKYNETNPDFTVSETLKAHAKKKKGFDLNYVETRKEGNTQFITINKPQRNNALDGALLDSLSEAFKRAEKDDSVHTIVLESVGGKHFVSGADIFKLQDDVKALADKMESRLGWLPDKLEKPLTQGRQFLHIRKFLKKGISLYNDIANSKKVVVAKVNGTALGGGTELALAADYVVASDTATFGLPEVKYGIFPAWGGTERLPQRVGSALAKFMVMEGALMDGKGNGPAILSADDARAIGLVDKVVPFTDLDAAVAEGLAEGKFDAKLKREAGMAVNHQIKGKLPSGRFSEKWERYYNASFDEIFENELKPLYGDNEKAQRAYRRAARLAWDRIGEVFAKADNTTRAKNMKEMVQNMESVSRASRK